MMSRFIATTGWMLAGAVLGAVTGCSDPDLVIRGGMVVDGSGAPARRADVVVREGRIVSVGDSIGMRADRVLDAAGLVVAPGFVDIHSHADLILLADPADQERLLGAKILQGVTTVVVGNCGLGVAPATPEAGAILAGVNGWMTPTGVVAGAMSVGEFLDRLERAGVALNVATLVPHGPVRISVMGLADDPPSKSDLDTMRRLLSEGFDAGALGLSTGLIYPPGMFSDTEELTVLAREAAARDRLFTAHVRGSSETLIPATEELIEIARRTKARVHHSHMEAVGEGFWKDATRVMALEDAARDDGLRVSHDVFVYTRAATMMSAIFPPWSLEGGVTSLLERLRDPDTRERIRDDIENRAPEWPPWQPGGWPHNLVGAVGWDGIIVASVRPEGPDALEGRSLAEIARAEGRTPFEVVADLMLSEEGLVGQQVAEVSGRVDDDDALMAIFAHPAAAVISDAEDYGRGKPHPAHAGAFPRALRLARERGLMTLEEVIRKMTSYPASIVGIPDRGVIREGAPADLVVFDPERVTDRATWEAPRVPAEGIRWVVINGEVVAGDGTYFGGLNGRVLRAGD